MNLDRKKVNLTQLRQHPQYRLVLEAMQQELADKREEYENTEPASEFLRGQVCMLRELLHELERNSTGK